MIGMLMIVLLWDGKTFEYFGYGSPLTSFLGVVFNCVYNFRASPSVCIYFIAIAG
jgi:hypothetical protein